MIFVRDVGVTLVLRLRPVVGAVQVVGIGVETDLSLMLSVIELLRSQVEVLRIGRPIRRGGLRVTHGIRLKLDVDRVEGVHGNALHVLFPRRVKGRVAGRGDSRIVTVETDARMADRADETKVISGGRERAVKGGNKR